MSFFWQKNTISKILDDIVVEFWLRKAKSWYFWLPEYRYLKKKQSLHIFDVFQESRKKNSHIWLYKNGKNNNWQFHDTRVAVALSVRKRLERLVRLSSFCSGFVSFLFTNSSVLRRNSAAGEKAQWIIKIPYLRVVVMSRDYISDCPLVSSQARRE